MPNTIGERIIFILLYKFSMSIKKYRSAARDLEPPIFSNFLSSQILFFLLLSLFSCHMSIFPVIISVSFHIAGGHPSLMCATMTSHSGGRPIQLPAANNRHGEPLDRRHLRKTQSTPARRVQHGRLKIRFLFFIFNLLGFVE